ncbi:MAG TPA: hypothetical protein DCY88_24530 [Cyanobacteria bacterium UBA11372]|nr:hypothetical protein [Cyanobacteria bacterium UBA11372]
MTTQAERAAHPVEPSMLEKGLTKREYIAALALQATSISASPHERAKEAVILADALLEVLHPTTTHT